MDDQSAKYTFPSPSKALKSGLLAIGGDLHPDRLIVAYRQGIFPWFGEGEEIKWYHPNPRFVLFPAELKISKSMAVLLKKQKWHFTENKSFEEVIKQCASVKRENQDGTWITKDMVKSYRLLHERGYAHSVEVWEDDELIGGFYGIRMGQVFFGESMFSKISNASKYAFISFVQMHQDEIKIIDCQSHTNHLESLGARMISRSQFMKYLKKYF